ncbi:MAG: endonuclease/exonuclease/phosphatase family protein [Bacteroidota bacterium]
MTHLLRITLALIASHLLCLTLAAQTPLHTYDIQGSGNFSPLIGQTVHLDTSVVIVAGNGFAFVQDPTGDGDPNTSDGLYLSDFGSTNLSPGQLITARGVVREFDGQTSIGGFGTTVSVVGSGSLPSPVPLITDTIYTDLPDLERLEGMYLDYSARVGGPSDGGGDADIYTTPNRPFREPGIEVPGINGLPIYDGNPEIIILDPNALGQADNRFLNAGAQVEGLGVLFEDGCCYVLAPVADATYSSFDPTASVRDQTAAELTIGSLNVLNLNEGADDYSQRLQKIANYIADQLKFPQILALQEVWGIQEINALSFQLRQIDPTAGDYRVFLGTGTGSISNGYLVQTDLPLPTVTELGTDEFLSIGGILHDRPPLLLEMVLDNPGQTPLSVINLHLRSLSGIEGSNSTFVRIKRQEQSISVAEMVNDRLNQNLVIVGDYNAFEFTDGYVDVVTQISGGNSLGAQRPVEDILDEPIQVLTVDLLPPKERYSFVFRGSAQLLDHCLATELDGLTPLDLAFGRGNCDAADAFENNVFSSLRASDHDGFVLFLGIDDINSTSSIANAQPQLRFPNPFPRGSQIEVPALAANSQLQLVDPLGRVLEEFVLPQVGNAAASNSHIQPKTGYRGPAFLRLSLGTQVYSYPIILE